ncbi:hypothetical protein AVEN_198789-1 [Araneus ventricosus]|uniref:Uncharacterized protein n=1 Tax=Araneus ventricosus TaxID=182803 RepID=A0A4Y2VZE4_ARAVE|nr:hypothetical protein AVEN_198789-1 [Araneus ventricosus]
MTRTVCFTAPIQLNQPCIKSSKKRMDETVDIEYSIETLLCNFLDSDHRLTPKSFNRNDETPKTCNNRNKHPRLKDAGLNHELTFPLSTTNESPNVGANTCLSQANHTTTKASLPFTDELSSDGLPLLKDSVIHERLYKHFKCARRHCPPYDVNHVSHLTLKFRKFPKYVVTRLEETTLRLKQVVPVSYSP